MIEHNIPISRRWGVFSPVGYLLRDQSRDLLLNINSYLQHTEETYGDVTTYARNDLGEIRRLILTMANRS